MTTPQRPTPLGSVLVTGGCGFLGSHIVSLILDRYATPDTTVHVFDLNTSRNTYSGATYHSGDLTSAESVRKVLETTRPNAIIHTASPVAISGAVGRAARKRANELYYKINVTATKTLVEEAKKVGCEVFVYTSSASVISDTVQDLVNADERYMYVRGNAQHEYYSDTKAEAEEFVLTSNTRPTASTPTSFLTTALRPASIFGEGDVQSIPNMLLVLKAGRTGWQLGDNDNLFDQTYVGNVAYAHVLAAASLQAAVREFKASPPVDEEEAGKNHVAGVGEDYEDEDRVDGRPFIITNHQPVYFWDFTRAVWAAYARHAGLKNVDLDKTKPWTLPKEVATAVSGVAEWVMWALGLGQPTLTPTRVRYACMTRYYRTMRAQRALGYKPIYSLAEGVERTAKWFAEKDAREAGKKMQ